VGQARPEHGGAAEHRHRQDRADEGRADFNSPISCRRRLVTFIAAETLIVANVLAVGPALVASRAKAASLLKAE